MKVFIFTDSSLDSGYLIVGAKAKKITLENLKNLNDFLFVLPNEVLNYVNHSKSLNNKKNLHASIINSINLLNNNDRSNLQVLECKNTEEDFFIINKEFSKTLISKFQKLNSKVKITSDLLFFNDLFNSNIIFNDNVFYKEGDKLYKLSNQAFSLLELTNINLETKSIKDINLNNLNTSYHEFNVFNVKSLFNFNANKIFIYVAISIVVVLNIIGLINIASNWNQIKEMDNSLSESYTLIYPDEEVTDLNKQIMNKLNQLDNISTPQPSLISDIIYNLPSDVEVIEIRYLNDLPQSLTIKCLFTETSQEQNFLIDQQNKNRSLKIINRETNKDIFLTEFKYEL